MNKDFPFTTYDFYAYLASGLILLLSLDFIYTGGAYFGRQSWGFVTGATAVSLAYIVGQIIAIPSSTILEHLLFQTILRKPIDLQMGSKNARWYEKVLAALVGRYYGKLPETTIEKVIDNASKMLDKSKVEIIKKTESIFQVAYSHARQNEDTATRLDDFRNQYGFSRNICFVALVIFCIAIFKSVLSTSIMVGLAIAIVAMFIRYIKFYAAFQSEILRTFAFISDEKKGK